MEALFHEFILFCFLTFSISYVIKLWVVNTHLLHRRESKKIHGIWVFVYNREGCICFIVFSFLKFITLSMSLYSKLIICTFYLYKTLYLSEYEIYEY